MKDNLTIRYVKKSDEWLLRKGVNEIKFLEKQSPKDKEDLIEVLLLEKEKSIRVLEKNNKPIGFVSYILNYNLMFCGKVFWISSSYVIPKERHKGYAGLLYKDVSKIAKQKGYFKIYCDVYDVNKNSIKFHRTEKFTPIYMVYEKKI